MTLCCHQIVGEVRAIASPFVRLIATDYYDGPTQGVVECGSCGTLYAFHKIDWDDGQDVRIFSLAATHGSFAELEISVVGSPRWPAWVLIGDEARGADSVQRSIDRAASVEFVVASRNLLEVIDVWRPARLPQDIDWFDELGCNRASGGAS